MKSLNTICTEYFVYCEKNKNLSGHTLKAYEIDLRQFQFCTGPIEDIALIDRGKIRAYHQYLSDEGYSPASIIRKLSCIKAMFRWLELEDVIEVNPFNKVNISVKSPQRLPKNIPASHIRKIIRTANRGLSINDFGNYSSADLASRVKTKKCLNKLTTLVALELMLCTGLRVAELVNLCLGDINLRERKIKVIGKGLRERYVFIPDRELCELLKSYSIARLITEPEKDSFLLNSRGNQASTQFIRKLIKQIAEKAGLVQKITPHMFRHSAACELLESGVDIRLVQKLLGHQSISTTEIYTHVTDSLLKKRVSKANVRGRFMKK